MGGVAGALPSGITGRLSPAAMLKRDHATIFRSVQITLGVTWTTPAREVADDNTGRIAPIDRFVSSRTGRKVDKVGNSPVVRGRTRGMGEVEPVGD